MPITPPSVDFDALANQAKDLAQQERDLIFTAMDWQHARHFKERLETEHGVQAQFLATVPLMNVVGGLQDGATIFWMEPQGHERDHFTRLEGEIRRLNEETGSSVTLVDAMDLGSQPSLGPAKQGPGSRAPRP